MSREVLTRQSSQGAAYPRWLLLGIATAMILASLGFVPWHAQADELANVPSTPMVEGPITGPGEAFSSFRPGPAGTNPEDFDYVTEEYFVSGTAGPANNSYAVRMAVRRPANPDKFSGTVVAEPTHMGGNALICTYGRLGIVQRGHICVDVMARPVNLNNSLRPFNLERYGHLHVSANQTNDILAQVGYLLRSNHPDSPLAGSFPVDRITLSGTSDSSNVTRSYITNAHGQFRMPDGGPIYQGYFLHATLGGAAVVVPDVPTIQMPTQTEVHSTDAYRQPDSDEPGNQFRLYEVAGMSHTDSRDNPDLAGAGCANTNFSQFPFGALSFMGLQHLVDWTEGATPPRADRIEVDGVGSTRVALDEFGNARGGVRSTYLDVPTHTHTIPNSPGFLCGLASYETRLPDDVLASLYRNRGAYVSAVNVRLAELIREGWFPREYADAYVRADMKAFIADW